MLPSMRFKKLNGATLGQGEIAELRKNTTCGKLLRSLWRCPTEASSGSQCLHGAFDCESTPSNAVKQPQQCDQIVEAIDGEPEASYGGDQ